MSNFAQGFQNNGFDPSLLYLPGNNLNVGGVSGNVGALGGASGSQTGLGDNQQNAANQFNMGGIGGNVGGLGVGNAGAANAAAAAAGGNHAQGWLNSLNSFAPGLLQSQGGQQQQLDQRRQPGAAVTQPGLGGPSINGPNPVDEQRQLELVSGLEKTVLTKPVERNVGCTRCWGYAESATGCTVCPSLATCTTATTAAATAAADATTTATTANQSSRCTATHDWKFFASGSVLSIAKHVGFPVQDNSGCRRPI